MASSPRIVSLEHRFPRRPIAHKPFCTLMKKYANGMNGFRVGDALSSQFDQLNFLIRLS